MITTEQKVIGGIGIATILIIAGGALFFSSQNNTSIPKDQILSETGLHWHPTVTVTIDGKKQEIPANLGIGAAVHGKIHTHDADNKQGIVHIEAQGVVAKDDIKLGNFFRVWGKNFSSTQLFDKKNGTGGKVKMLVNGKENKEFQNYHMKDGDKIEIKYE
jgi:hypothetical protein